MLQACCRCCRTLAPFISAGSVAEEPPDNPAPEGPLDSGALDGSSNCRTSDRPLVVIHFGVNSKVQRGCFQLERCAFNTQGVAPHTGSGSQA
jgi:hypothetical protein